MSTVYIHIEESLSAEQMRDLKEELLHIPHVSHVEMTPRLPHDLLVEFEAHHNVPIQILHKIEQHGLHPDIVSG